MSEIKMFTSDKYGKYMSSNAWSKNWSIDYNPLARKIFEIVTSYYRKKIKDIFLKNNVRGDEVLELGCGTAEDTFWILNSFDFKCATVVDFSEVALNNVERKKGNFPIKLVKQDILKLRLDKKYDLVHSGFVIEHFYGKNRELVIQKHAEFVSKNGFVFIQAPGKTFLSLIYSKTINKINGIDELLYKKNELVELLRKARLKIVEFVTLFGGAIFFVLAKKV